MHCWMREPTGMMQKEMWGFLNEDHAFSLRITPLSGREVKEVTVTLDGVPERPVRTTRIRLTVSLEDVDTVKLRGWRFGLWGNVPGHPIRYGRRLSVPADGRVI